MQQLHWLIIIDEINWISDDQREIEKSLRPTVEYWRKLKTSSESQNDFY